MAANNPDLYQTMNAGFVQAMYEQYLRDPGSVDAEWRQLFENGGRGLEPVAGVPVGREPSTDGSRESGAVPAGARRGPESGPAPAGPEAGTAPGSRLPLRGAAARLVANMEASLAVPTATSFRDVPVAVLDARRKQINAAIAPARLSYTHIIAWALVQAARQFPVMTHVFSLVDGTPTRVVPDGMGLGLAVDVEKKDGSRALVVPAIPRADALDFAAFHSAYETLVQKARTNTLMPDDFRGATMTLTNPGTIGTVASVPRLMAGQGSIIATGAIRDVGSARVMTITSTYDHRVIQGAESGMFLRLVDQLLQGEGGFYEGIAIGRRETGDVPAGALPVPAVNPELLPDGTSPVSRLPEGSVLSAAADVKHVAAAMALVRAHRLHGHALAQLDPLGTPPAGDPACDPDHLSLSPEVMARIPADVLRVYVPGATMAEVLPALRAVYCGTMAYEFEHIASHEERVWLRQYVETGANRPPLAADAKRKLLERLTAVDAFERFLHKTYLGQKRFSIEGLDVTVPMLDLIVETLADKGARDVVIGMAHRGRLSVLTHVVNLPYDTIIGEFESHGAGGGMRPEGGTGDVKYHHGAEGSYLAPSGQRLTVTLLPNPSHLEAVNPVVEGRTRAEQTRRTGGEAQHETTSAVPVLLHGDAAFSGQGILAETFNLAKLKGYTTGGTMHIITNNQVGFTTDPRDARSTDYASDLAKGFDAPIVHVNADDPEACLAAVRLALVYRERYHNDVVIDVVGYRRWGHNEGDEPLYTQPLLYERIRQHPTVRQVYAGRLAAEGVVEASQADALAEEAYQRLSAIQTTVQGRLASVPPSEEPGRTTIASTSEPITAVAAATLLGLNEQLLAVPEGFTVNPKLKRQLDRRREAVGASGGIEWAHAEALAWASLLVEGVPVRLTGQDAERGTFSQRHLMLHDPHDGRRFAPIQYLSGARASMELHNSPLSEYACLGFEYGYAVAAPETLVLWEAQFGDFANGAEIIVDQFICAGLAKWGLTSRLTLLLPHGYEGQGPEHSSARIERYVALGAEGNIRVANCSTPAQYFHLLRRQARHPDMRPLIIFTPKSLLRLPAATSRLEELSSGAFQPVLDDPTTASRRGQIERLALCSGKVYYDIIGSADRAAANRVAVARVEMLYPLPTAALTALIGRYPNVRELAWVQEEPRNMGARKFLAPDLRKMAPAGVKLLEISRPERASPAEGYPAAHASEQARIVREALAG